MQLKVTSTRAPLAVLDIAKPGWLLLVLGEALMLATWLGIRSVFIGVFSLPGITIFAGAVLCLIGPALFGRGRRSAALGIGAALFGLFGSIVVGVAAIAVREIVASFP